MAHNTQTHPKTGSVRVLIRDDPNRPWPVRGENKGKDKSPPGTACRICDLEQRGNGNKLRSLGHQVMRATRGNPLYQDAVVLNRELYHNAWEVQFRSASKFMLDHVDKKKNPLPVVDFMAKVEKKVQKFLQRV